MPSQPLLKVLIADDHRLFGDALQNMLSSRYNNISQVSDGMQLLHAVKADPPDLLLLDINLPKLNGLEAAQQIRLSYPQTKIIVISMYNQQRMLKRAQELKLEGYLLKDSPSQLLMQGIESVLAGKLFYDPKLLKIQKEAADVFEDQLMLTNRERQIIRQLIEGKKAREIASALGLGYETVKTHRKNIYLKLQVSSLIELVNRFKEGV